MRCRACDTVWLVSGPPLDEGLTEKRAAVSRRGADREKRDLFATRSQQDQVSAWETMRPPPPSHQPVSAPPPSLPPASTNTARLESTLATRNENSVLFKVTDVFGGGATARMKTPEPSAAPSSLAPAKRDDSGVIDLKALSEARQAPIPRPVVAPLFGMSEPPPAAFARDAGASSTYPAQSPVKSKLRSIGMVFAAAALVAGIGVGVTAMFKAGEPPAKAAAAPPPPEPPPPPVVTAPPPAPEPPPAATSSAADDKDKKDAKTASGKKGKHGRGGAKASSGVITNKSAPPPPPPKVKAADPCGCHGDFNCILACTAGKK